MAINRENVRRQVQRFDFKTLFIEEMNWANAPGRPATMTVEGTQYQRRPIAQLSGVMVFEIVPLGAQVGKIPDAKTRKAIYKQIQPLAHENLLIFVDHERSEERTQSLWYWVKREGKQGGKEQPREHLYLKGQPGDLFLSKLDGMVIELDELRADGSIPITEVTRRLASSLDVERVTKRFYNEFSTLRIDFINLIEGIDRESDRQWYGSVLLHRLMFIYFLQKKGFIQNNTNYLDDKLIASQQRGPDRYYAEFLQALFFEGFAKPNPSEPAKQLLGPIKYLNGGLFLKHRLEDDYPNIRVPDLAFANLLDLFGRYSWHLDDTPGANDNEINPDVLGYIFEKYINQKAFGAYYTRPEITQYLCERTIHAVLLAKLHQQSSRRFDSLGDALLKLDADLCRRLLHILEELTVLDPACGSGAFLVAAIKTLLDIYAALYGRIKILNDTNLTAKLNTILKQHRSLNYYIRKQIITQNLYGVDIMEEAVEIARLRLFLALVASAQTVDELEPLPNIDFNLMAGNSLIGLLKVDEERFDAHAGGAEMVQGDLFQSAKADSYRQLLQEKNRLISIYRNTTEFAKDHIDLQLLREQIDNHKAKAYATLHEILLDDFQRLKIQYEAAQPNGKPKKRPLTVADIQALQPFHWGYEFDEVMDGRGGFDVIITNPPWEIFKPQAREFFADYSDVVSKSKTDIKEFEKEQERLLQLPEVQAAWLEYQSRFPHVSAWYRAAPQFINQIAVVNGKKAGTDINLYKLFTEQCFNLLRDGGECGIVIPSGIYTDLGAKQLREMLFTQTQVHSLFGLSNEKYIFEGVHHGFKICFLVFRKGDKTTTFEGAFRINTREAVTPENLGSFLVDSNQYLSISVPLVRRLAPDSLSIMEFKSELDVRIAEKMLHFPLLGENVSNRWQLQLWNEFHMTNDSHLYRKEFKSGRLPLYEGKMIHQFTHQWESAQARYWIDEKEGRVALLGKVKDIGQKLDYQQYRLAFRDVAASTNARTMIMTVLPPGVFCPHTMSLEKINERITASERLSICALMNSFVVDASLRHSVTAHVSFFFVYNTPLPRLTKGDRFFDAIVERAARLICTTPEFDDLAKAVGLTPLPPSELEENALYLKERQPGVLKERRAGYAAVRYGIHEAVARARLRAELDGMVAHIYGLTEVEFAHILNSFPLVPEPAKVAAQNAYRDVERGLIK